MQNIQDVQNSKKIVSKQESIEFLSGVDSEFDDSEFDAEQDTICEMDVNDDENQEMSMKTFEHQLQDDDLDVILQLGQNFVVI
ncbi:MAG: hypothetical protein ACK53Y_07710 [bacterium]